MRRVLALALSSTMALAVGCEPMDPSENPLEPVTVAASTGDTAPADSTLEDQIKSGKDPRFGDEPATLTSEDTQVDPTKGSESGGGGKSPTTAGDAAAASTTSADSMASTTSGVAPAATLSAWPVRLVRTHLDEQPPSAVLAMPDGRRVVVSPGDMVPERGLIVMAIGKERVQLAQVSSRGDHATVAPVELTAQY